MRTWVREGGKMYYGKDVLKTKTAWKLIGAVVGIPLAWFGGLALFAKLRG